jgi:tRNA A-37 threonylcarbamoyl transferase component Bud32
MDKFEKRFVIKFLFIKGIRSKLIHTQLESTSGTTVCSLTQVKELVGRFKRSEFFHGGLGSVRPNEAFTQDYFISFVLSDLKKHVQAKAPDRTGRAQEQLTLPQRTKSR